MKSLNQQIPVLLFFLLLVSCSSPLVLEAPYESDELTIHQVGAHSFVHVSYLQTETYGKVACNGLVVMDRGEALVFDTPADAAASEALLQWIREKAKCKIKAVVPTHFHVDCLGTLNIFHREGIPSYAYGPTVHLAKAREFFVPQHEFSDRTEMSVGAVKVEIWHPGAGHTSDNVVAYVPVDKTLFGGCLVKSVGAGKGNLNDADVAAWPTTAAALRNRYPELQTVVPGHGKWGGVELLAFTEKLFAE